MLTEQKPLMKALRRSHTSSSASSSSSSNTSSSSLLSWIHLRSVLLVVASSLSSSSSQPLQTDWGSLKSPWSHRRRKHALLPKQWKNLFTANGKLIDGGVKFLKKIRSGGVDPSIRAEVWPFLLGVYDFNSSKKERDSYRSHKRKEYENLRKQCRQILKHPESSGKLKGTAENICSEDVGNFIQVLDSPGLEDVVSRSHSIDGGSLTVDDSDLLFYDHRHPTLLSFDSFLDRDVGKSVVSCQDACTGDAESSDSDSSKDHENTCLLSLEIIEENNIHKDDNDSSSSFQIEAGRHLTPMKILPHGGESSSLIQ